MCFHALATHPTDTPCPVQCCNTALDVATNDEVKAALRQHGARYSLFYAAEEGILELVADLIKEGADVNERDKASRTALHYAAGARQLEAGWQAREGHEALAQGLLGAGADINAADEYGWTPLHHTARNNKPEVAKVLLANRAQVNVRDIGGRTPLHTAAEWNKPEVAKVLLANGAQVNARTKDGWTALGLARRKPEMEALLLQPTE